MAARTPKGVTNVGLPRQSLAQPRPRGWWCSLLKMTAFVEATVVVRTILTIARKWPQTLDVSGVVELACARMVDTTPKRRTPATHQVTLTPRQPQRCSQQLPRLHQRRVPASATKDGSMTGTIVSGSPGTMAATGSMACAAAPTMGSFLRPARSVGPDQDRQHLHPAEIVSQDTELVSVDAGGCQQLPSVQEMSFTFT